MFVENPSELPNIEIPVKMKDGESENDILFTEIKAEYPLNMEWLNNYLYETNNLLKFLGMLCHSRKAE